MDISFENFVPPTKKRNTRKLNADIHEPRVNDTSKSVKCRRKATKVNGKNSNLKISGTSAGEGNSQCSSNESNSVSSKPVARKRVKNNTVVETKKDSKVSRKQSGKKLDVSVHITNDSVSSCKFAVERLRPFVEKLSGKHATAIQVVENVGSVDGKSLEHSLWKLSATEQNRPNVTFSETEEKEISEIIERDELIHHSESCGFCLEHSSNLGDDLIKLILDPFAHLQDERIKSKTLEVKVSSLIYSLRVTNPVYEMENFTYHSVEAFVHFLYSGRMPPEISKSVLKELKVIADLTCCKSLINLLEHFLNEQICNTDDDTRIHDELYKDNFTKDSMVDSLWIVHECSKIEEGDFSIYQKESPDTDSCEDIVNKKFELEEEEFLNFLDKTQANKSVLNLSEIPTSFTAESYHEDSGQLEDFECHTKVTEDNCSNGAEEFQTVTRSTTISSHSVDDKTDQVSSIDADRDHLLGKSSPLVFSSDNEVSADESICYDRDLMSRLRMTGVVSDLHESPEPSQSIASDGAEKRDEIFESVEGKCFSGDLDCRKKTKRKPPDFSRLMKFVKTQRSVRVKILQFKPIHILTFINEFEELNPDCRLKEDVLKGFFDQIGAVCSEKTVSTV